MAANHANLACVLKIDPKCDACKKHVMEVMGSIQGLYDVTMDAEKNTVSIYGEVQPNFCTKALARCGRHAELIWANLKHPRLDISPYNYDYNYLGVPHGHHRRSLPEGAWHETPYQYPGRSSLPEYSYNGDYCYDGARNALWYPNMPGYGNPYYDQRSGYCSIM